MKPETPEIKEITTIKDMNIYGHILAKNTVCKWQDKNSVILNGPENWGRTITIDPKKFIAEIEKNNLLPNHKA